MLTWWRPVLLWTLLLVSMGCGHGAQGSSSAAFTTPNASLVAETRLTVPCHDLPCCDPGHGCHCSMILAQTNQDSHDQPPWYGPRLPAPRIDEDAPQSLSWIAFLLPSPNPLLAQRTMLLC